jgi:hypothetical protein
MEIQDLFYAVATVALVVVTLFVFGLIYLGYRLLKLLRHGTNQIDFLSRNISGYLSEFGKTWSRLTVAGIALKLLRGFIFRR